MHIYLGSDHGGYELKTLLNASLQGEGVEVTDCGSQTFEPSDYPDYAVAVAKKVAEDPDNFGLLLCRSGEGMEMAANKIDGIRAALVWNEVVSMETRRDNNANILVLPADFVTPALALVCVRRFLATPFSGLPRHLRRLEKLAALESTNV